MGNRAGRRHTLAEKIKKLAHDEIFCPAVRGVIKIAGCIVHKAQKCKGCIGCPNYNGKKRNRKEIE